jgi:acyl-CoA synthetase (NDP forming)
MRTLADKLLRPERIAIVGASGDPKKLTARPQSFLRKHGYNGTIYPINPGYTEMFGEVCYPNLAATPEPAEHAIVMVATEAVEDVIRQCGARGVAAATILAGGFAEAGDEGRKRQERVLAVAREGNVRLVGPNSLGIINTTYPATLSANAALQRATLVPGRVGVVSQSGSMIGGLISRGHGRNLNFSTLVSIGNESDLSVGEVGQMLLDDPATDVLVLFLETLRNRPHVDALAEHAQAIGKPVMAYVLGRSELGRTLAVSHTGAMIGGAEALDAYLASCGFARVRLFESLFEAPPLLRGRSPANGRRVAIATTTGGGAAIVADHLGERGIEVVVPAKRLRDSLKAFKLDIPEAPIVDLTLAGTREEVVDTVMRGLLEDDRVDAIAMVVGSSAEFYPELAVKPLVKWAKAEKPIVAFLLPNATASLELLAESGIAAFRTPEACADALDAYLSWRRPVARAARALPADVETHLARLSAAGGPINEMAALDIFAGLGVAVPRCAVLRPGDPAPAGLAYPVVAKVMSADIAHKSEVGGVLLGITEEAALKEAAGRIVERCRAAAPQARIEGVLVAEMHKGLGEAIVGYRIDPLIGPTVVVGVGGILAEVYKDAVVRPAPVDRAEALNMISAVKGFAPMRGYRGLPKGDLSALADVVVALSRLALSATAIAEAEINPVIVKAEGQGAIAVDALLVSAR